MVVSFGDRCVCVTGGFFWIVVGHISLIVSKPKTTEISLIVIDRLSFSPLAISFFAFTGCVGRSIGDRGGFDSCFFATIGKRTFTMTVVMQSRKGTL